MVYLYSSLNKSYIKIKFIVGDDRMQTAIKIDTTALFTLSYGIFILGAENNGAKNACIINTCQQVGSEPMTVSISVLKTNLTHYMVDASKKFTVSVLGKEASLEQIKHFGFNSGRDINKFIGITYETDEWGTPVIKEGAIATMSCRVTGQVDLGSHTLFIGEVMSAQKVGTSEPMTYAFYRDLKAGKVKVDINRGEQHLEKVEEEAQYQCTVCHHIYDGEVPFEELPDDYVCPVCGKPKSVFQKI